MAGIAKNGWKWLENAGQIVNGQKLLEIAFMAGSGCKWMEYAVNCYNSRK